MNKHVDNFTDYSKAPANIERLVEAIMDGDKRRAIDLLCENYPQLVSYHHQASVHSTINSGRGLV